MTANLLHSLQSRISNERNRQFPSFTQSFKVVFQDELYPLQSGLALILQTSAKCFN